ncbi:MAG: polyribonucleotide nucleotidyltransferase [Patescibacteria group bacterium]|nr:polyribonucleotide nucleotidyltransferase [Patescibacteria group bacterium]MCL5224473.1 polyribonucleotide nucleotidyltransferase [Patescibacteria group bacterium]
MNLDRKTFSIDVAGRPLTIEVSRLAEQANGAVMANYGETTILATVVMGKEDKGVDYLPLSVDYEERFYAAGKIIGSRFVRREGRPSDESILSGRIVDRAIRPLFDQRIRREIQVVITVVSYDEENDPDLVALTAVSTALGISNIPFAGPVSGLRVAKIGGDFKINPLISELANNPIELETFVAGAGNKAVNMIELSGDDAQENDIMKAFGIAVEEIDKLNTFQQKIIKEIGQEKETVKLWEPDNKLKADVLGFLKPKLEGAVYEHDKTKRDQNLRDLTADMSKYLEDKGYADKDFESAAHLLDEEINELVHQKVLTAGQRPDGRHLDQIRDLYAEVGVLHRTHGSAVFIRGNTQALAAVTIAPPGSEQLVESMEGSTKRRFMLHYNFPPFSVGETGRVGAPGRREIGHGKLAEKAIRPLIPPKENFPYTIRVVSEILSSNGSSSMATVCASSLALMDAGVPIKKPAAGIAMGLMSDEKGNYKVLTDIQGPEDHHGDMDFKVAGTREGVNALQMDIKVYGVSLQILQDALGQARKARLEILDVTDKVLSRPRPELSRLAPRVLTVEIDPSRIGELVGPGGKVINGLIASTGVTAIDIEQDGKVFVSSVLPEAAEKAVAEIRSMMREFKVGEIVEGDVIRLLDFGAIVDLGGGRDGMVHVSEIKNGFVKNVSDVLKLGDHVRAKVIKIENGKIGLSIKQLGESPDNRS